MNAMKSVFAAGLVTVLCLTMTLKTEAGIGSLLQELTDIAESVYGWDRIKKSRANAQDIPFTPLKANDGAHTGEFWEEHVKPRVEEQWTLDPKNMSSEQKQFIEDVCQSASLVQQVEKPEDIATQILVMGMNESGLGFVLRAVREREFLNSEVTRKDIVCLFQERITEQVQEQMLEIWPEAEPTRKCMETIYNKVAEEQGCV